MSQEPAKMTNPSLIERITRSLAYMLRHKPEEFDIELDRFGAADVDEVVQVLNERLGEAIEEDDLLDAIEAGDRVRYSIDDGRIRALYGHSIEVDPGEAQKPQELLYVGLGSRDAERAERYGLRAGRRSFLHLAKEEDQARESGKRQARRYVVMTVFALDAWEQGINFYDRGSLYLSEPIPTEFLEMGEVYEDGSPRTQDSGRERRGGRREGSRPRGRDRDRDRDRGHDSDRGRDRDRDRDRDRARDRKSESRSGDDRDERSSRDRGDRGRGDRDGRQDRESRDDRGRGGDRDRGRDRGERGGRGGRSDSRERPARPERSSTNERPAREDRRDAPRKERAPETTKQRAPEKRETAPPKQRNSSFGLGLEDSPQSAPVKEVPRPAKSSGRKIEEAPAPKPAPKNDGPSFGSGV